MNQPHPWRTVSKKTRYATIITIVLVAAAIVVAWAMTRAGPGEDPEQPPPTSPAAGPTEEPTDEADGDAGGEESPGLGSRWSTVLTPRCGEVLTGEDLDSLIEFTAPPSEIPPRSPFHVRVQNTTTDDLLTEVDRYDFAVPVLTNATGEV